MKALVKCIFDKFISCYYLLCYLQSAQPQAMIRQGHLQEMLCK